MRLTKEEKRQRQKERDAERHRLGEKFPSAVLSRFMKENNWSLIVSLGRGDDQCLQVRWTGEWPGRFVCIHLADIEKLGQFIHALTCRYNAMVDEANSVTKRSRLKRLMPMKS